MGQETMPLLVAIVGLASAVTSAYLGYQAALAKGEATLRAGVAQAETDMRIAVGAEAERLRASLWAELDRRAALIDELRAELRAWQEYVVVLTGRMREHDIEAPPPPALRRHG